MKMNTICAVNDILYQGIPLSGWESVEKALYVFAFRKNKWLNETEKKHLHEIGIVLGSGRMTFSAVIKTVMQNEHDFVKLLVSEAKDVIKAYGRWKHYYENKVPKPFERTTVIIEILDKAKDLFCLYIQTGKVADIQEEYLASALGISRNLLTARISLDFDPEDNRHFAFDFDKVFRIMGKVFHGQKLQGPKAAEWFVFGNTFTETTPFVVYSNNVLMVTIEPGQVEKRFVFNKPGEYKDTWVADGAVLRGLLDDSYYNPKEKQRPSFLINIRNANVDEYGKSKPIWEEQVKYEVQRLTGRIMAVLSD